MVGKVWDSAILRQKWFHLIVVEFGNFGLPVDGIQGIGEVDEDFVVISYSIFYHTSLSGMVRLELGRVDFCEKKWMKISKMR